MSRFITIFILILSTFGFKPIDKGSIIPFRVDCFQLDVLGNLYVVHESELVKYNDQLEKQATFTNLSLGEISSVDASDAMNIMVFYQDFAKIVFLDNTLSPKNSTIDLSELGFPNASLACLSYNNSFWIFDPVNQELVCINQFLEINERSGNLNQIIDTEIEPDQLFESGNYVYLKDRKEGVFIFDRYGGYMKRMPFVNVDDFQMINANTYSYLKSDTLFLYNSQTLQQDTLISPFPPVAKIKNNPNIENLFYSLDKAGNLKEFAHVRKIHYNY